MQQKMMKYMMVFMAFMFYKVPSGLGIYFITSSLWPIGERLLLPKITKIHPGGRRRRREESAPGRAEARAVPRGNGASDKPGGWWPSAWRSCSRKRPRTGPTARTPRTRTRTGIRASPGPAGTSALGIAVRPSDQVGRDSLLPAGEGGRDGRMRAPAPRATSSGARPILEPSPSSAPSGHLLPRGEGRSWDPDAGDPFDPTDTIAAVASPPGPGFRGLVRLTGPEAWPIALAGFVADRRCASSRPRRASDRPVGGGRPQAVLPASIALWPGPRTYTGSRWPRSTRSAPPRCWACCWRTAWPEGPGRPSRASSRSAPSSRAGST